LGRMACFLKPVCILYFPDVERYSDKYQMSTPVDNAIEWSPGKSENILFSCIYLDICTSHTSLKEEEVTSEEEEEKEEGEEGKEEEEEEYDEEEFEEETDYIMSYFDNGEDFGGDSDDNIDEAIY
uniref:DNA-directed RNA polymerase III subunit n=1 Tax=Podarcis muralis TaxID=64176 RepID=A0A670JRK8_PODMU